MALNIVEAATNIATSDAFGFPGIATLANGDFAIVYTVNTGDFDLVDEIVLRVFDAQGQPLATGTVSEFAFFSTTLSVGGLSGGGFALAWNRDARPLANIGNGVYTDEAAAVSATIPRSMTSGRSRPRSPTAPMHWNGRARTRRTR